jgi:hypothetical protein
MESVGMRKQRRKRKKFTNGDRVVILSYGAEIVGKVIDDRARNGKYVVLSDDGRRFEEWPSKLELLARRTVWNVVKREEDEWARALTVGRHQYEQGAVRQPWRKGVCGAIYSHSRRE